MNQGVEKLQEGSAVSLTKEKRLSSGPSNIGQKDINDMVLAGHNVQKLVESNTYSGLQAKLKFNTWKKI